MKLIVSIDNQSVRKVDLRDKRLPIHFAAKFAGLSIVSFLLDEYPESATIVDIYGRNLLHLSMDNPFKEVAIHLNNQYPELNFQQCNLGRIPLIYAFPEISTDMNIVSSICNTNLEVLKIVSTRAFRSLPLHQLIDCRRMIQPVSPLADTLRLFLRLFLRLYPAAANIKDVFGQTPYDIAVNNNLVARSRKLDNYFLRLLLRADISINPQELYRLNYQERRMALFLSSGKAIFETSNKSIIWRKLWIDNIDILKEVVSFL